MKIVELGSIIQTFRSRSPKGYLNSLDPDSLPYIDVDFLRSGLPKRFVNKNNPVICDPGEVVMISVGSSTGFVNQIPLRSVVGNNLMKVTSSELTNDYLFYFLRDNYQTLNNLAQGTSIPFLNMKVLNTLKVPLPSLDEQQKLVEPLVLLDAEGGASSVFRNSADSIKKQFSRKPLKAS
ncbi:restriction modification system DNA specificity domain-containing protein [Candidatus Mycoplasma haematolamae str. Purdue]|uniref:Restriction modification system DNA specificity domain-containing protein n=1 Tax=Mycoplasma haematolamae (strain Purdue) TaxID=1212765 RepID=I7BJI9_MYCHA|nr:restriction endonuclease subunit S [Candidatus Mycoplasma haematolamae]AFO52023.1 restriction modification system DNA specificity domain-containing protein [Candidatus Mycoplasma haematolamae str. Purdue]